MTGIQYTNKHKGRDETLDVLSCFPAAVRDTLLSCGIPPGRWCEIRLRADACSAVGYTDDDGGRSCIPLPSQRLTEQTLREILTRLCAGSVHAYDEGLRRGFFSPAELPGVRIGAAGQVLCRGGSVERLQSIRSLCLRLPHSVSVCGGIADALAVVRGAPVMTETVPPADIQLPGAAVIPTLFYAPPGEGKTTLLRCLIRTLCSAADAVPPLCGAVLDSGGELSGGGIFAGCTVDCFCGYPRGMGMALATRAFSPQVLFCDEIGTEEEAEEILRAQATGVPLIATAHADSFAMLLRRPCFARLHEHRVFARYVRLRRTHGGFDIRTEAEI